MPASKSYVAAFAASLIASIPSAALADVPGPVRAMIDAAIDDGDPDTVRKVIELARTTNPDDGAELDAILAAYETDLAAAEAEEVAAEERAIRSAGLFENWSGRGELGAFNSTGNSSNTGITASLALTREGINWRHKLRGRADYQRNNGVTTREQFLAAFQLDDDPHPAPVALVAAAADQLFFLQLLQDPRQAWQQQAGLVGDLGRVNRPVLLHHPQHPPLLLGQTGAAQQRPDRTHHTFPRPEQSNWQRTVGGRHHLGHSRLSPRCWLNAIAAWISSA